MVLKNGISFKAFTKTVFNAVVAFGSGEEWTPQEEYLYQYLSSLTMNYPAARSGEFTPTGLTLQKSEERCVSRVRAILIENVYFSRNYRDEYAAYYSKCFRERPAFCKRVHYFTDCVNLEEANAVWTLEQRFAKALLGDKDALEQLEEAYVGFSVVRPVSGASIGTTAVVPHNTGPNGRRFITSPRDVHISGLTLHVDSAHFLQQDESVESCATVSIWVAFRLLPRDLIGQPPTSVRIAELATKNLAFGRIYPARKGLDVIQMSEAIRQCGWPPDLLDPPTCNFAGTLLRSYLLSKIPVIAILNHPGRESHALTIVGWEESTCREITVSPGGMKVHMNSAKVFYVHDDRTGPYCKAQLVPVSRRNRAPSFILERLLNGKTRTEKWRIEYFIIPYYGAVKTTLNDIYVSTQGLLAGLNSISKQGGILSDCSVEITITSSQNYLKELGAFGIGSKIVLAFLKEVSLPRYIGLANIKYRDARIFDFIWDTTDFSRSASKKLDSIQHIMAIINWQEGARELLKKFIEQMEELEKPLVLNVGI